MPIAIHGTVKLSLSLIIFQHRGHHINSPAGFVLLWEEKKVADWIFVGPEGLPPEEPLLSDFLRGDRGRASGHIPLLTQRGSLRSFKARFSAGCLKRCVCIDYSNNPAKIHKKCQSIH